LAGAANPRKLARMGIRSARAIALEVLLRVEREAAFAADLLHARLRGTVRREDAALATELVFGVLRWQRLLDVWLARHLPRPPESLDVPVRLALRLGAYQLRFLNRIPAHAAVNESVEWVKRAGVHSAAALVNAVLRRMAKEADRPVETLLPASLTGLERLAVLHSHPTWLVQRWLAAFGEARTVALLQANNAAAPLACAVHEPSHPERVAQALRQQGLTVAPGRWLQRALLLSGGSPTQTAPFRSGQISMQDEASQMIPLLLAVEPGARVLDLCAAPGGKTVTLARAAGTGAFLVAADRHAHRLRVLRQQLARTGTRGVALVLVDATAPLPWSRQFSRILLDAPCSGTGTLARNPEIRWRLRVQDLQELHARQVALLRNALAALAPGGRLVYSTCSLEPEENEQVVAEVLAAVSHARLVEPVRMAAALAPHLRAGARPETLLAPAAEVPGWSASHLAVGGVFRTFPPEHGTDGFFAVAIELTELH
jgi:16S rRNA (cytosine967-C5)-methyltransferase